MSFLPLVEALRAERLRFEQRGQRMGLAGSETWNVLVVAALRGILEQLAEARGATPETLAEGRLFSGVPGFEADARESLRARLLAEVGALGLPAPVPAWTQQPVEAFGQLYEMLLAARPSDSERSLRKRTGSYYTPEALTRLVVERAFAALDGGSAARTEPLRVLDPAMGAGAFLLQAGRALGRRTGRDLASVVQQELFGVDVSPLAVAVAEASLWLLADAPRLTLKAAGAGLCEGDALCPPPVATLLGRRGIDFATLSPARADFDLVLGNPPWVAFAGRATQPLAPELREHYRRSFVAFRGYPTLHALFVELAARLSPRGVIALLIPSPVADLEGYRPVRAALAQSHEACEPLLELGQDAFQSVTQPCFALVARPRQGAPSDPGRALVLSERRNAAAQASELRTPPALERLRSLARLPAELFGEMGLQTSSAVTRQLLYRGSEPPPEFSYALLEGRNIAEFRLGSARLHLKPDAELLARCRCRLRDVSDYARVKLVVRQTAAITIAAAHDGTPFRNSLLAGFELPGWPWELTLGLLNSTLYRALHLAARRDARQGAFPQVKIAHLRSLPAPPSAAGSEHVAALARAATERGLNAELRRELDQAVFGLFGIAAHEAGEIRGFVRERSPKAGLVAPLE